MVLLLSQMDLEGQLQPVLQYLLSDLGMTQEAAAAFLKAHPAVLYNNDFQREARKLIRNQQLQDCFWSECRDNRHALHLYYHARDDSHGDDDVDYHYHDEDMDACLMFLAILSQSAAYVVCCMAMVAHMLLLHAGNPKPCPRAQQRVDGWFGCLPLARRDDCTLHLILISSLLMPLHFHHKHDLHSSAYLVPPIFLCTRTYHKSR